MRGHGARPRSAMRLIGDAAFAALRCREDLLRGDGDTAFRNFVQLSLMLRDLRARITASDVVDRRRLDAFLPALQTERSDLARGLRALQPVPKNHEHVRAAARATAERCRQVRVYTREQLVRLQASQRSLQQASRRLLGVDRPSRGPFTSPAIASAHV
ncbi:MAG: hypothetical protein HOW73_24525 [Polyangiaceae bacterium]|nr:hypothetical protein [Polyangiaceae bacterium]